MEEITILVNGKEKTYVSISCENEGFKVVKDTCESNIINLYNYVDGENKLLSQNEDFKAANNFKDGLAVVKRINGLYNYIKLDGTLLSEEDFESIEPFEENFAVVLRRNGRYNYIKSDGMLLSIEDFNYAWDFKNGFAVVERINGLYNYIKPDGTLLSSKDFHSAEGFEDGHGKILVEYKIDKDGNII